jgi:TonB-linked SusC/RagA family outer membrane protein
MRDVPRPRSYLRWFAIAGALALSPTALLAQAVITGRVTSDAGVPLQGANVYINDLNVSVGTNETGTYTINLPAARVGGQAVNVRVRSVGFVPQVRALTLTSGRHELNFQLKADVNRLSEIVVTGVVGEAVERAKVPYAVSRLAAEDMPVPALDPITQLSAKMPGVRIASTSGAPGSNPEILIRGPKSINAAGRDQRPLVIVDGAIMSVGSLDEIGGLDIESVEVVKGAAGASLYGSSAANGVIVIKTKRGGNQDGVQWNFRSEYGFSDLNSLDYGQSVNHPIQIDETGTRLCVAGGSGATPCSRSVEWMKEIMRINNVNADTVRTPQVLQWSSPGLSGGDLQNVYQAGIWPGRYYDSFAQVATNNPFTLNSLDASGRMGQMRFYASASHSDNQGAVKGLDGQQHTRGRVNLDFNPWNSVTFQVSTMYDRGKTDLRTGGSSNGGIFGQLLRGAPAGTDYLARDTLGRPIVRGGGGSFVRPTGNGAGTFLYDMENLNNQRRSERFLGNASVSYFPTDWLTLESTFAYDNRHRIDREQLTKGYRTITSSTALNNGQMEINNRSAEAYNASLSASLRRQLRSDLAGRLSLRAHYDRDDFNVNEGSGQAFLAKDIYTITNTTLNKTATSTSQSVRNMGVAVAGGADYKERYILEAALRYDGSSLFGEGERWAPFGRVSAVWRVSEEPFWGLNDYMSDFRLRASRGTAGGRPRFTAQYETYNVTATGITLGQAGNSKLKPETTTETELGTEFTLFNRLGVELTHAFSDTRDQILEVNTPSSLGFATQWQNAGTLSSKTWELALNLPIINRRDVSWSMRGTWDRTRTHITELFAPEYVMDGGTAQGTGSFFLVTARGDKSNGIPMNRYGNIWGRKFYKGCGDLPAAVRAQCGTGKAYQVNDEGWVVWVGEGNSWRDGITKNLWQTKLPEAQSPWNYPLWFGHPIIDRPLRGEPGEGSGILQIIGNVLPDYRLSWGNNFRYKKLTVYAAVDGTIGHEINNQGEGWGLLDLASSNFDQGGKTVETAKPLGYGWRVGGREGAGTGGFYDQLGPNNYNVESGSYAKIREISLTYSLGPVRGVGDWTLGLVGRNLYTFTDYSGYDPEVGSTGGTNQAGSGLINQTDAFDFPTLRSFTFSLSTRF